MQNPLCQPLHEKGLGGPMRSFFLHPTSFGHHDRRTSFLVQKRNDTPPPNSNESIYSSTITIEIHEMTSDMYVYIYIYTFIGLFFLWQMLVNNHVHIMYISYTYHIHVSYIVS